VEANCPLRGRFGYHWTPGSLSPFWQRHGLAVVPCGSETRDVDWRVNKDPKVCTIINTRAALGQLIGHKAPAGKACEPCQKGNSPLGSFRIVFLPGSGFQWSFACACCQWSSAANNCTLRGCLHLPTVIIPLLEFYGKRGDCRLVRLLHEIPIGKSQRAF
jgi:hypothetical protein